MTRKAKYISSVVIDRNYLEMMFEYRGETYFVTRPLSWTACSSDYTIGGSRSEVKQHRDAQAAIDRKLDNPATEYPPQQYAGSCEEGFDKFWEYVNQ